MLTTILLYAFVGAIAGVLAGLLGVGGGLVIVPMMVYALGVQQVSYDVIMHMALGTSLASIMFTSISSFMAHHARGAVRWDVVRRIVLGILVGTFVGSWIAAQLSTNSLKAFFVLFLYYVAAQFLLDRKPKPDRNLPGSAGMLAVGNIIGIVSSFVGIGGGSLSVPFMIWCNIPVRHAIGTSAAIGFPIALSGAVGYVFNGWGASDLPAYSLGYVYLPGLLGIVAASVLTAPLGARLAHTLPVQHLKRIFAVLLLLVGTRMLVSLL